MTVFVFMLLKMKGMREDQKKWGLSCVIKKGGHTPGIWAAVG